MSEPARLRVPLLATLALLLLVQFRPIRDVDLLWQIRTGELMLETGQLVRADPFTSTHAGTPTPTIYWLSQLGYALVMRFGSWTLLHRLDATLFAAAFGVVMLSRDIRRLPPPAGLLAFGLAALVALPFHGARPQTFALLGFALLVLLERAEWASRRPWLAGLATLGLATLWQNLHPSAATAAAYLGLRLVGRLLLAPRPSPLAPCLMLVAAAAAVFATPDGFGVLAVMRTNAEIAGYVGIEEWLPLWDGRTWPAAQSAALAMLATAGLFAAKAGRPSRADLVTAVGLAVASLLVYRLALFWAAAMLPIWAASLAGAAARFMPTLPATARLGGWPVLAAAAAVALGVPFLAGVPALDPAIPLEGVRFVRERGLTGPVYNYREWGGPLIWGTRAKVTIDGRLYLFPREDWDAYDAEARGERPLSELESRVKPQAFFLRPGYHDALIGRVRSSPDWRETFADGSAVVFERAGDPR